MTKDLLRMDTLTVVNLFSLSAAVLSLVFYFYGFTETEQTEYNLLRTVVYRKRKERDWIKNY